MNAVRRTCTIVNQRGLHARASAKFVNAVSELPGGCSVKVAREGNEAAGGSILGLMMLGAARGDTVDVIVEGEQADQVLDSLCALIDSGFGED
ncbi:MAG: HPr family phosphocarrier protein [Tsuneonella suprasediminis]|uniref:HPr family phosphocarrier protein n=1 Tax=Tsuneonella suprasediminis TaxID=2306996 RepID=A0A419QYU8_9SPHN|nr:HPr family phosphocarrier protein [Tsuneonella suprasediminis]RJX65997.1 HPr family phosphocarrier protein [Tsuneonella suprasediminis]UBS32639.1 HPr family phosphocarrier protein [Altererythrobacter sp. N1]